ncbi:MAG: hypothetical protein R3E35_12310 [Rhodocyclaceae bacterium]
MTPKVFNRVMIVFWIIFISVAELGATGSYGRMAGVFVVLAVMVWMGWMERDNSMREVIDEVFDEAHKIKRPNVKWTA